MIVSFGNSETEKVWNGFRVKNLPIEIQNIGRRTENKLTKNTEIYRRNNLKKIKT